MIEKSYPSLKAMAEAKVDGVSKTTNFQVDPRIIVVEEGFNARPLDPEHVASIKEAYKAGAYLPPLCVRVSDSKIVMVDGHHRLAALLQLIAEGAEIMRADAVHFRGNDADRVALVLTTAQGKPLTPLQAAFQYRKLAAFGWKVQEIAARVGKSGTHIANMLELTDANSDVLAMVENNEVSAGVAVQVVKQHGDKAGAVLDEHLQAAKASGGKKVLPKAVKNEIKPPETPTRGAIAVLVSKHYGISVDDADRITKECFSM